MVYIKSLIAFYLEISLSLLISTPCHLCIWPKILAIPEFLTLCSYYKPTTRKHIASPCFLIYSGNIAFLFPLLFSHRHLPNTRDSWLSLKYSGLVLPWSCLTTKYLSWPSLLDTLVFLWWHYILLSVSIISTFLFWEDAKAYLYMACSTIFIQYIYSNFLCAFFWVCS